MVAWKVGREHLILLVNDKIAKMMEINYQEHTEAKLDGLWDITMNGDK